MSVRSKIKWEKSFLIIMLLSVLCLYVSGMLQADKNNIKTWPIALDAKTSSLYSLKADKTMIPVEHYKDIHYAQFTLSGQADLRISVKEPIVKYSISPKRLKIKAKIDQNSLLFTIKPAGPQARQFVVRINSHQYLFIFVNPPEKNAPIPGTKNVLNILDYGVNKTGSKTETSRIQAAINAVPENGTLFFPPGIYSTGTLHLKSNMTIYLAGGCLIRGTGNLKDYTGSKNDGKKTASRLILIDRAENVSIKGHGIIDSNGRVLRIQNDHRGRLLYIRSSKNILIEGIILRDSPSWNTHIVGCDNVTIRNVKIINDLELRNTDAFDLDASSHVLIENCFAFCSDDAAVIKCAGYDGIFRDVEDIIVRNNIFMTKKSALKVGTESRTAVMKDITFQANDVIFADRGMVLYCYDGATFSNIRFIDNHFEENYPDIKQRLIDFNIVERKKNKIYDGGMGQIHNVLIRDCMAYTHWPKYSTFRGSLDSEHTIADIRFENHIVNGKVCRNRRDAHIRIDKKNLDYVKNITFFTE